MECVLHSNRLSQEEASLHGGDRMMILVYCYYADNATKTMLQLRLGDLFLVLESPNHILHEQLQFPSLE
jgi:hypothetical protein